MTVSTEPGIDRYGRNVIMMSCDNINTCGGRFTTHYDQSELYSRARLKGWHIFEGTTEGGAEVAWVLCPVCVGQRGRRELAPPVLEGQQELF